uniref:Double zinc ribbon and ankyrin repeat-containing protein 1 n=1 Tax=Callorhinchus milii TaxID=7868 RepID=A0A4W3I324_CALMI
MTAGSIAVPRIIPLRTPLPGKSKHEIDTNTPIEIKSDTSDVDIYYTLDGNKPQQLKKSGYGENSTLKYRAPFTLHDGKITVKALAITGDGRESGIVTKVFLVEYVSSNAVETLEDDGENFLKDCVQKLSGQVRLCNSVLWISIFLFQLNLLPFRCAYCLASRPSDPFARFCQECGSPVPPVPGSRLPPPEGGQMGLCMECKSMVPLNTPTCIVCEASIAPQLQPQASIRLKDKIICGSCGTGNPANVHLCVTCETRLSSPPNLVSNGGSSPRLPSREGKMLACSKCGRVNNTNARFCDWCGAKPFAPTSCLKCLKCGGMNHPYAYFCGSCGAYLEPPARLDPRNSMLFNVRSSATWQPMAISLSKFGPESNKVDQGTQTVGLFYPSCKVLEKKEIEIVSQREKREKMSDRRPLLTAVSPGRGFWRKQLDHICAHLRSYAQNNTESLRISFLVSCTLNPVVCYELTSGTLLFSMKPDDRQLLTEVGSNGDGRISVIQELLDEGADPNCTNNENRPVLTVAVLNQHHEVIPVLVQKGADIEQQSGLLNNTALHEAAELGAKGLKCVDMLLGCNASLKKKNDKGLTAYDLAVKTGNDQLVSLFTAKMGQGMLDKLTKPKHVGLDVY